jgi:outer membrane protein assembly factor BamB
MRHLIQLIALAAIVFACQKQAPIDEEQGVDNHPVLWKIHLDSDYSIRSKVPTIDEADNIYVLSRSNYWGMTECLSRINSFNKQGEVRWEKTFQGKFLSRLIYHNSILLLTTCISENSKKLYLINDDDGSLINQIPINYNTSYSYGSIVEILGQNICLISDTASFSKITLLDLGGNEKWHKYTNLRADEIYTYDNSLYLKSFSKIQKYSVSANSCNLMWEWQQAEAYHISKIHFGNDGSLFFENSGDIYHLSSSGQLENQLTIPFLTVSDFQVSHDNKILIVNENLFKYDLDGNEIWRLEQMYNNFYISFRNYSVEENGMIYIGDAKGVFVVNTEGEIEFMAPESNNYIRAYNPVVNSENNLICLSYIENNLYCLKGDL